MPQLNPTNTASDVLVQYVNFAMRDAVPQCERLDNELPLSTVLQHVTTYYKHVPFDAVLYAVYHECWYIATELATVELTRRELLRELSGTTRHSDRVKRNTV